MAKGIFGLICETASLVFFCVVFALYIVFAMVRQWIRLCVELIRYLFSETKEQTDTIIDEADTQEPIS